MTVGKYPLVSVVITNRDAKLYLRECLHSLMAVEYPHLEVVVVDNASTDGSVSMVATEFPSVKIVSSDSNLGWAGGNNLGLRFASGSYILFLNNDAFVKSDAVMKLAEVACEDQGIGILGCKIYFPGGLMIQHAGGILRPSSDTMLAGYGQRDKGQFDVLRDVDWVSGAAIMVRRDVVDLIGGFETLFGLYFEEADLCYRARRANFRVVYVPNAIVYHHMSVTVDRILDDSSKYDRYQRSRIAFVLKNFGNIALLVWFISEIRNLSFHVGAAILGKRFWWHRSDPRKLYALLQAYKWNFLNLSTILHRRSEAKSPRRNILR